MALQLKQMGNRDLAMGLIAYQLEQAQKAKPNEMIETWTVDMGTYWRLTLHSFSFHTEKMKVGFEMRSYKFGRFLKEKYKLYLV